MSPDLFQQIESSGGRVNLSARAKFRLTGGDRVRYLNGQVTNDVRPASPRQTIYACVTDLKGRIVGDVFVHSGGDSLLLDAEADLREVLGPRLERYIIADDVIIPSQLRDHYSEKIAYLPWYQCNDAEANAPTGAPTREACGLPKDAFVFCSFNNSYKITPHMFELWMRILRRVPKSVLWLYAANPTAARNLTESARERGIAPDRLIFAERVSREAHLARQACADLILDTFPYNGGATSSNALRAGVPVLTRTGEAFAARMGASLLSALGLHELIAESDEAFENVAVEMATNPAAHLAVKAKLANVGSQPLFSASAAAQNLEMAYEEAVARSRGGDAPANIAVSRS